MDRHLDSHAYPLDDAARAAAVLGVHVGAPADRVRAAFRQRARETHPDLHPGSDGAAFREVQWAYERLTRTEPRQPAALVSNTRVDTITVNGLPVEREWDPISRGFYRFFFQAPRSVWCFYRVGRPDSMFVEERQFVRAPATGRKLFPHKYIVLHGLLFPITQPSTRLLAMDLVYLDPKSPCPYALVSTRKSWLLVRQQDGRLLAQNSRRGFSRVGGYAAFSDASGVVEPVGERIFPPFEAPLTF